MNAYKIVIRNEKIKKYKTIGWLFVLLNIATSILVLIATNNTETTTYLVILLNIAALSLWYRHAKSTRKKSKSDFVFVLLAFPWLFLNLYWVALVVLVIGFFQGIANRTLVVQVNPDRIIYPSFPARFIHWHELSNIILKDDLLTIDFKNNKIIQQLIEKSEPSLNEKEFNDFCDRQLELASASV